MNNFLNLLEEKIKSSNEDGQQLTEKIILLLFDVIRNTNNIDEAELVFKNLQDIHFVLAKTTFSDGFKPNAFLKNFIYDFDRIDDNEVKIYQYNKIKE